MKQVDTTVTMRMPNDYDENYVNTVIANAIVEKTQGCVESIGKHIVLATLPDDKKFIVCIGGDNVKDTKVFHGDTDNVADLWDEGLWSGFRGSVVLGLVIASSAEEAVQQMAERGNFSDKELFAYELKD